MSPVDNIQLNFDAGAIVLLSIVLGVVMFGIALDLTKEDFRRVKLYPRAVVAGVVGQFLLLPAMTFLLVCLLQHTVGDWFSPSMALGLLLVAACPGGNMSNFFSHLAKGSTGLSVTLTAISSVLAVVMTPLNFVFWAMLNPETAAALDSLFAGIGSVSGLSSVPSSIVSEVVNGVDTALKSVDVLSGDILNTPPNVEQSWGSTVSLLLKQMFVTVFFVLALPLFLGMLVAKRYPLFAARARKPFKIGSLLVFALFIVLALVGNGANFFEYIGYIFVIVLIHNAVAFFIGWALGKLMKCETPEVRSLTIEVGIQNSGLGLLLIFSLLGGLGGMALMAAWWGVWHLVSGLLLGGYWAKSTKP